MLHCVPTLQIYQWPVLLSQNYFTPNTWECVNKRITGKYIAATLQISGHKFRRQTRVAMIFLAPRIPQTPRILIWSDFDCASSLICGNKMPTKCNRCFYCRSYCLLNMFKAPLFPSSGAREYYTVGCCQWYLVLGFQVVGMVWSWGLCVRFAGCWVKTTGSNQLYNTLELLMMGIMVPETCWANNKTCNKKHLLHLVVILFPHIHGYSFWMG
jgi:hypothetical protein